MNERGAELLPAHTCIITSIRDTTRVLLDFFVWGRLVRLELDWNKSGEIGTGLEQTIVSKMAKVGNSWRNEAPKYIYLDR